MATYVEVTDVLVSEGYLPDADIDAAIVVLTDALVVAEAEEIEAEAIVDIVYQEEVIEGATDLADDAAAVGDFETEALAEDGIEEALDAEDVDAEIIEVAEAVIDAAYVDAAAALVAAALIDEANAEAAAAAIAGVWVMEDA